MTANNNKRVLIAMMVLAAVINAYVNFWGRWWIFGGVLGWQLLATKEIASCLFNQDVRFLKGSRVSKEADNFVRRVACFFYAICYVLFF